MPFEAYFLAVDPDLASEFESALGESHARLRALAAPQDLIAAATGSDAVRAVVVVDDAARLDPAWWRLVRDAAPESALLVVARRCDEEMWRRWTLLGGVGVLRPPFPVLDVEAEFASEPLVNAMFRRNPQLAAHGKTMFRYSIPSDAQYIPGMVHVIALLALEFGFSVTDYTTNIPLAVDEAISNAIKHGNRRDPQKRVEIEGQADGDSLRLKVRDQGEGFERDPNHDPVDPANLLSPSGRGLFLIESLMDEVRYSQEGRCIEMIKKSRAPAAGAAGAKAARGSR